MEPVQDAYCTKVDSESLVVKVVHDGPTEKVEAAVDSGGLDKLDGEESPPGEDMDVKELWRERDGNDV